MTEEQFQRINSARKRMKEAQYRFDAINTKTDDTRQLLVGLLEDGHVDDEVAKRWLAEIGHPAELELRAATKAFEAL
jgi:hypothetical protein